MNTTSFPYERVLQTFGALLVELRALQALVQSATVDEQRSVVHSDSTAQAPGIDIDALLAGLQDMQELISDTLAILRVDLTELAPPELYSANLDELLSRLVEESAERLGATSRLSFSGVASQDHQLTSRLSEQTRRMLYLITREALYQIEHRPDVHRIRFTLNYGLDHVQMSLEDDGIPDPSYITTSDVETDEGPDAPALPLPSFGMLSSSVSSLATSRTDDILRSLLDALRVRLVQLGGSFDVATSERGTRILVQLPYSEPLSTIPSTITTPSPTIPASSPVTTSTDEQVTILLVDSRAVSRAGLHRLLESYPGLYVIGEAVDGLQAVSETLELGPQVVLLDAQLPDGQSLEALRQIKQLNLNTRVLVLATQDREEYLYETLRAGADGYVLKDIAPDDLAASVRSVARGDVLIQPQLAGRLLTRYGRQGRGSARYDTLTTRELEVLRLLARGLRNKEIASRLVVSERTVNFHLANIYQKLQVSGRTEALSKALEQGLITTS
jgi:DNA-binding NarL/FixJ family response regulator